MCATQSDLQDKVTGSNSFSYRYAAFQLPEASDEFDVDDRDRPYTAAATLGAIEANLVWFAMIVLRYFANGPIDRQHGPVGSFVVGLFEVLIVILVCFVPFGALGALTGLFVNFFLHRSKCWFHAMSLVILTIVCHVILETVEGLD